MVSGTSEVSRTYRDVLVQHKPAFAGISRGRHEHRVVQKFRIGEVVNYADNGLNLGKIV